MTQLIEAKDYRVRAAAVKTLRYNTDKIDNYVDLLMKTAADESGRVRLESIVTASWLSAKEGTQVLSEAAKHPIDDWMDKTYEYALAHVNNEKVVKKSEEEVKSALKGDDLASFIRGKEIFGRDGYCETCHQKDGEGLDASGYPPLKGSEWVLENEEVLIKVTLKGLSGPITVLGKDYPGEVPMTPYEGLLNDQEIADVLTYVRNSFGNVAPAVKAETVKFVRDGDKDKKGFYTPADLIRTYQIQ